MGLFEIALLRCIDRVDHHPKLVDVLIDLCLDGADSMREYLAFDELLQRKQVVGQDLGQRAKEGVVILIQLNGFESNLCENGPQSRREFVFDREILCNGWSQISLSRMHLSIPLTFLRLAFQHLKFSLKLRREALGRQHRSAPPRSSENAIKLTALLGGAFVIVEDDATIDVKGPVLPNAGIDDTVGKSSSR